VQCRKDIVHIKLYSMNFFLNLKQIAIIVVVNNGK